MKKPPRYRGSLPLKVSGQSGSTGRPGRQPRPQPPPPPPPEPRLGGRCGIRGRDGSQAAVLPSRAENSPKFEKDSLILRSLRRASPRAYFEPKRKGLPFPEQPQVLRPPLGAIRKKPKQHRKLYYLAQMNARPPEFWGEQPAIALNYAAPEGMSEIM